MPPSLSCLHPLKVVNPRYKFDELYDPKNTYFTQQPDYFIIVPCGKCYLCRKKAANAWAFRLDEELHDKRVIDNSYFLTFTFNSEKYKFYLHLDEHGKYINKPIIIRRWRQLFRKKLGVSPRYFLVEDCGSQYGRIHLHGILIDPCYADGTPIPKPFIVDNLAFWINGIADVQPLRSRDAVGYICGYISGSSLEKNSMKHGKPICEKARKFIPRHFVSNGIGKSFVDRHDFEFAMKHKDHFLHEVGNFKRSVPRYLIEKIYEPFTLDRLRTFNKIDQFLDEQKLVAERRLGVRQYKGKIIGEKEIKHIQTTLDNQWGCKIPKFENINKDFNFYGEEFAIDNKLL